MSSAINRLLDSVKWEALPPVPIDKDAEDIPYATHAGILEIAGHHLQCFQFNNGMRIFSVESIKKLFAGVGQLAEPLDLKSDDCEFESRHRQNGEPRDIMNGAAAAYAMAAHAADVAVHNVRKRTKKRGKRKSKGKPSRRRSAASKKKT